jgi:hypothetical protein
MASSKVNTLSRPLNWCTTAGASGRSCCSQLFIKTTLHREYEAVAEVIILSFNHIEQHWIDIMQVIGLILWQLLDDGAGYSRKWKYQLLCDRLLLSCRRRQHHQNSSQQEVIDPNALLVTFSKPSIIRGIKDVYISLLNCQSCWKINNSDLLFCFCLESDSVRTVHERYIHK